MKRGLVVEQPSTCNKEIWREKVGKLKTIIPGRRDHLSPHKLLLIEGRGKHIENVLEGREEKMHGVDWYIHGKM